MSADPDRDRRLQCNVLLATTQGRPWSKKAHKQARSPSKEADASAPADYRPAGGESGSYSAYDAGYLAFDASDERQCAAMCGNGEPLNLANTFEDERGLGELPSDRRIAQVKAPCVVARNDGPNKYRCHCCGNQGGYDVQLPLNVFSTAYRVSGGAAAVQALVELSTLLVQGKFEEVYQKTTCCKKIECLIGQDLISADAWCAWVKVVKRPQLVRGTDRKDQSRIFSENLVLLRVLAMEKPRVMSVEQLRALFEFLVLNSQFIQEREKRFIATAMAVVENSQCFNYKFADPQSVVERMAQLPRNYASLVIFPHVIDETLSPKKWVSKGNRLLETSFFKSTDALFAILCDEHAATNGYEEVDGRIVHRIPEGAPYAHLFTADGFEAAVTLAVDCSPKYTLHFATNERDLSKTASMSGARARRDMHRMLAALSASQRRSTTIGKGARAAPTCGSKQSDSGVHTVERYTSVFRSMGLDEAEAAKRVAIFIDQHKSGNRVGFEKLKKGSLLSKACATIRPPEVIKPLVPQQRNGTRASLGASAADAVRAKSGINKLAKRLGGMLCPSYKKKQMVREEQAHKKRKHAALAREQEEKLRQERIRVCKKA